jgi:hypothetical protein
LCTTRPRGPNRGGSERATPTAVRAQSVDGETLTE